MIHNKQNDIIIRDVDTDNHDVLKDFVDDLNTFMGKYQDPLEETMEAIRLAIESGFCVEAVEKEDDRLGVLAITPSPFEKFQPKYHLAYIATSLKARGRGVGKLLLKTSQELTKGDIALHVGVNNDNAIKFYEKMGWKGHYLRMMPIEEK